jgi:peptidoglycan/LPS O-acetylase OafA/YrhL
MPRTLLKVTIGMFFGSMLLRGFMQYNGWWNMAMGFTPCRVDGLAAGAFIALVARSRGGVGRMIKPAKILGPLSLVLLGLLIVVMHKMGYRRGIGQSPGYVILGSALFALFYGSILIYAVNAAQGSRGQRFFSHSILRIFGKYSYAVYLLHLPVMVLVAEKLFHPAQLKLGHSMFPGLVVFYTVTWSLSLLAALVSWSLMEKHFLKLKDLFPMEGSAKPVEKPEPAAPAPAELATEPRPG